MSDNTSAVAVNERLATELCLWSEKRGMTLVPCYLLGPLKSVSGPSVQEGSNPQDRLEPKPDRSRQDFSCLGQTIRGSVRPR